MRKLLLALTLALAFGLPLSAYASSSDRSASSDLRACVNALQRSTSPHLTLGQAKHCAPDAIVAASQATGDGTFIVGTPTKGYVIITNKSGPTTGDPCAWHETTAYDVGVWDWEGATFCWDYRWAWMSGGAHLNCGTWAPWGACHYYYYTHNNWGYLYELVGWFYQQCCNLNLYIDQWNDGSWDSYIVGG